MNTAPKPRGTVDPVDEWGMYDPAKAGLEALFLKLGLSPEPARDAARSGRRGKARRRERPSDAEAEGVCSAIAEARRRAMEVKAAARAAASPAEAAAPAAMAPQAGVPSAEVATEAPAVAATGQMVPLGDAPVPRTRATGRSRKAKPVQPAEAGAPTTTVRVAEAAGASAPETTARKPRSRKAAPKAGPSLEAAPATGAEPEAATPVAPAPARSRSRRPAPLAAWARNAADVVYAPAARPRLRAEIRVSWRSLLAIPAEVAGVQYARGARIRRVVIEADEQAG